ncbi:hypothetical protein [Shewanella surugensis]|uniref:Uncharacterized protein n=1 Tax=Shewanella surugensis TaxID=212020 RepID=A0ABT0LIV6_9GAMM|nr:hypothetical protein [Shewanella surugensis]MCL1127300.1 hypothetical protein [Shewanella surugensis]
MVEHNNIILNEFISSQPVVEQVPAQADPLNIVWHKAFWVNSYINSMSF